MAIGTRPLKGFRMIDGEWLRGLSDGDNRTFRNGLAALAGGAQAGATAIPSNTAYIQFDTVATAADSAQLPPAIAGKEIKVYNSTANAMAIFANVSVNKATGAVDTINRLTNATAISLGAGKAIVFFCAKDGQWAGILSA